MKLQILAIVFFTGLVFNSEAASTITNCGSYGPTENNLYAELDEDDLTRVTSIGYVIEKNIFPLRVVGCSKLQLINNFLFCDGRNIATAPHIFYETEDDMFYRGFRAKLVIDGRFVNLSGSCRPQDKLPLTIRF